MAKYQKGCSGNPAGRPVGVSDKRSKLRDLLEPHAPDLILKLIAQAKKGEPTAMKLCIDRLIPKIKDDPLSIENLEGTLSEKSLSILALLAKGELRPSEADVLLSALSSVSKLIESDELIKRIEKLEEQYYEKHRKPHK